MVAHNRVRQSFLFGLLTAVLLNHSTITAAARPNVVMIMTDNHGAWTLGCYGNDDIRTTSIDRLAKEGTLFDNAFASNPVCSPTRATVLTGLIPSQHGVHCFLRGGNLQVGPKARCTLDEFRSMPEILRDAGYRCGLVGKWHLGANMSPQEGFDDYWITMPHGGTSTFYDAQIIEDGKLRKEPKYLTDFWTEHAVQFISEQKKDQPFFLFLSYNGPYSLSRLLLREGKNRHAEFYRDKELPSFPREKTHPWQLHNRDYINNPTSIRRVATEVSGVDDGVGTIMETLKAAGLDDNTLVIFLADQGWVGGHGGFFGMGDHTRPVTAVDGMMKIPMIWRQPGQIAADRRSKKLVGNYDVLPSLLDQLDLKSETPKASPGRSFAKEFDPKTEASSGVAQGVQDDDAVFYEFESLRCIRTHEWKYTERHPNGPNELYNLKDDPEEFHNLYVEDDGRLIGKHSPSGRVGLSGRERAVDEVTAVSQVETSKQTLPARSSRPSQGEGEVDIGKRVAVGKRLAVQRHLKKRLHDFFAANAAPKYDLWNGGGSQTFIYDGIEEETSQAEPIAPPALPDDFVAKKFTLPEGFSSQLIAGPPLVNHPTMGCFDDRGRLFVCDGAGVNMSAADLEKSLPNRITMLEDQDGDGVFDKSTVFADKMTFPMGGAWHDGALYVASPPNIWRLEDTTGDGKADKRDIIVDKFGYSGNAASIHGCFFSPDGRLYWCDGYHGHEFKDDDGNVTSKRKGSYIFSCWPDGSDVRIHCGGGMDNPVEVDFTDKGDVIGTVNILYTRPRIDCLVHWQYGGAYPHREAVLDELKVTGPLLGPIHKFGHVAVSGTTRYRSGTMDHRWRDNFFTTFFNLGKIVRVELERSGSTYSATQREFLSCANRDFHPTDVIEDADGSLLVVDTGGWFYRGCPTSQIAKPDVLGGIYRIRRDGMTKQVDPRGLRIDWTKRTATQLMKDLKDTRFAVRERAIHECAIRPGPEMEDRLGRTVESGDILARQNALWAIRRMEAGWYYHKPDKPVGGIMTSGPPPKYSNAQSIRTALTDRDERIRETACNVAVEFPWPDTSAFRELRSALSDESMHVRVAAARALGKLNTPESAPALVRLLSSPDRNVAHAATYALIESGDVSEPLLALHKDAAILIRASLANLQRSPKKLAARGEPLCRWPDDPALQQELFEYYRVYATAFERTKPDDIGLLNSEVATLFAWLMEDFGDGRVSELLLTDFVAEFGSIRKVAERVGDILADKLTPHSVRTALLNGISRSGLELHASWTAPLIEELHSGDSKRVVAALRSVSRFRSKELQEHAETLASNESNQELQFAAIECLLTWNRKPSQECFETLYRHAAGNSPGTSEAAARLLGGAQLSSQQLARVAELLPKAGPQQLRDLVPLFSGRRDVESASAFLSGLEAARSFTSLPMLQVSEVVKRFPPELHDRANRLLDRLKESENQKLRKLDSLIALLPNGSAERGRDAFFSEKSKCATCHIVGEKGKRVGPDLTKIGASRTAQDLLESIVFPSSTIVRQYEPYTVVTTEGRTYSGLVIRDAADVITLQQTNGDPVTIRRDRIEELAPGTVSIMPKGLDEALTPEQLADLVAWLQTLE